MGLLHKTEIENIVNRNIRGNVARIGGRMNQLINYKNCKVTDINIIDGGYGKVRTNFSLNSFINFLITKKRHIRQELYWFLYGEREMRDRKTLILDMHFAIFNSELEKKFDSSISSNVIEHSPNPIWFLLNFYFITKDTGYQYHAIPNYKYIFDMYRQPTKLEHIIDDFEQMRWFDDNTHNEDYYQSAVEKHGHQKEFHKTYPISYPYIHFHVFDENTVLELLQYMFEDVTVDCLKTEKFNDNVVIFKNKLNEPFLKRYSELILKYKQHFFEKSKAMNYSRLQNYKL